MKDLYTVQKKAVKEAFGKRSEVSIEDLLVEISHGINEISSELMKRFKNQRLHKKKVPDDYLEEKVKELLNLVTVGYYALDLEVPEIEEVMDFSRSLSTELKVDSVLLCHNLCRSTADMVLTYFCESPEDYPKEELEEYLLELMSSVFLLSQKVNKDLALML